MSVNGSKLTCTPTKRTPIAMHRFETVESVAFFGPYLQVLTIDDFIIDGVGMAPPAAKVIASFLKKAKAAPTKLALSSILNDAIRWEKLTSLDLSGKALGKGCVDLLKSMVLMCTNLEVLKLANCGLGHEEAIVLLVGLKDLGDRQTKEVGCTLLRELELELSQNRLMKVGVDEFAKAIKANKSSLQVLGLRYSSADFIPKFHHELWNCTKLERLFLNDNLTSTTWVDLTYNRSGKVYRDPTTLAETPMPFNYLRYEEICARDWLYDPDGDVVVDGKHYTVDYTTLSMLLAFVGSGFGLFVASSVLVSIVYIMEGGKRLRDYLRGGFRSIMDEEGDVATSADFVPLQEKAAE
ncbi:uncharacterized protein EV422DRAFT_599642 [Fimicolochytrium jonesii]|uniref:uncharacterized protein n=1 Tax=Fimicolochytrium jonesii TaxID=1396493 RepID=UPI0022FF05C4|nr:uncharacterized protein EV422DRAFT_599642 [Fimicolochytrium jonesii]KAI8819038.1 hypothetical protein EV422DRAFT_599642 [Fimicolochytrium jonesii]